MTIATSIKPRRLTLPILLAWSGLAFAQTDEIQVYDGELASPGQFTLTPTIISRRPDGTSRIFPVG